MAAAVAGSDKAGIQPAIHAIGDRANAEILDIFTRAGGNDPRNHRFRIEHAQHARPQDFARFAKLGVIASMQPYHAIDDGRWAEKRIGESARAPATPGGRCSTPERRSPSARTGPWPRSIRCSASTRR